MAAMPTVEMQISPSPEVSEIATFRDREPLTPFRFRMLSGTVFQVPPESTPLVRVKSLHVCTEKVPVTDPPDQTIWYVTSLHDWSCVGAEMRV
jgi:hypothetical protein